MLKSSSQAAVCRTTQELVGFPLSSVVLNVKPGRCECHLKSLYNSTRYSNPGFST